MKQIIEIKRLSSFTLLKIMFITSLFPWVLIDTGVILFHLLTGDFIVNYTSGSGAEAVAEQISLTKYVLYSYPLVLLVGAVFTVLVWLPCAFSLWCWSKFRNLKVSYYEVGSE